MTIRSRLIHRHRVNICARSRAAAVEESEREINELDDHDSRNDPNAAAAAAAAAVEHARARLASSADMKRFIRLVTFIGVGA